MTQEFADLFLRTNDSQWEKAQSYVQLHHPMIWFSSSTELKMRIGHRREFVSRSFEWAVFKAYRSCNTPNWWCTTIFLDFFPTSRYFLKQSDAKLRPIPRLGHSIWQWFRQFACFPFEFLLVAFTVFIYYDGHCGFFGSGFENFIKYYYWITKKYHSQLF